MVSIFSCQTVKILPDNSKTATLAGGNEGVLESDKVHKALALYVTAHLSSRTSTFPHFCCCKNSGQISKIILQKLQNQRFLTWYGKTCENRFWMKVLIPSALSQYENSEVCWDRSRVWIGRKFVIMVLCDWPESSYAAKWLARSITW